MFLWCCYFGSCCYSLHVATPWLLFLIRGYSPLVVPNLWLFLICCSSPVAPFRLLFFVYSYSLFVCSLHVVPLHLLFPACCFSLLVAPHSSFFLACCSPFITPPRLLLPTCRSSPLATPCLCFPRWYSLPLFAFASSLWNHKQQVKTNKQSEFFFFLIPFLFYHLEVFYF